MARSILNLTKLPRVSMSNLPFLFTSILIFGGLYAVISYLSGDYPFTATCGSLNDPILCKHRKSLSSLRFYSHLPSLTIFTAPTRPFSNFPADPQYQALLSWLSLVPSPKIVMLGNDPSFYRVAKQLCDDVIVEPNIDHNLIRGTQQVHSMFARAHQANTELTMVVDTETMLLQDFMEALHKTHQRYIHEEDWVLFGRPWHVKGNMSMVSFTKTGPPGFLEISSRLAGLPTGCNEIANYVRLHGTICSARQDVAYWAWKTPRKARTAFKSLLPVWIPPFFYVRGTFEDWILEHLITGSKSKAIIDGSDAITSIMLTASAFPTSSNDTSSTQEAHINALLSKGDDVASQNDHSASFISSPLQLMRCAEPKVYNLCFVEHKREEAGTRMNCNKAQPILVTETSSAYMLQPHHYPPLDELLPQVADQNKVVVMVGGTSNYKEMLSSFLCRAQSLGVENFLVAAFDEALFDYAYKKGFPVYLESVSEEYQSSIGSDRHCVFASECFKRVSKLKSMSVLRVLKKGYSVLWSDMDIVWFQNPLPQLIAHGPGILPIQSDEPNENMPENFILGANSGFYLARSEEGIIHAFEAIVDHATKTDATEQPSFYAVLCGEKGERRVGDRECSFNESDPHGGLRTVFLNHQHFPNGYAYRHWDTPNASKSCQEKGCVLLHNNFIAGKENKLERLVRHGLWYYDVENEMCIQPWHPLRPTSEKMVATFQAHFLSALNITNVPVSSRKL